MKFSKNFPAVLAIAIPSVFIAIMLFAVYLPSRYAKPSHSFAYTLVHNDYNSPAFAPPPPPPFPQTAPFYKPKTITEYFVYDVLSGQSRSISEQEFKTLPLDKDADYGQTINFEYGQYNADPFTEMFGSSRYETGVYVESKYYKKKLFSLNYEYQFTFAGWLK